MPPSPAPVSYPLGPPSYQGNTLTVDTALQQPTRVTRRIADLTLQRFIVSEIFANDGGVSGGAVVYDQALLNELYLARDVERVNPGDEFPVVTSERQAPRVAEVEKWGGKFFITDEARDRNDVAAFNNQVTQLANTIVRKLNTRAIETLEAAIAELGGAGVITGGNWASVITAGASQSNATAWPGADFAKAQLAADREELGVEYNLWLVNPVEKANFYITYGSDAAEVLAANGVSMFPSNRVPQGTAYAVARGQVGGIRIEKPLSTETWREEKTQRNWVQSSVRPVMYVTNPYSIKKVVGLGG
ncbi:hypothetical protein DMP17_22155 [Pseudonocardia sp. TMWB2A]|uniref:major capsid protein n=1 Tax=Pseudonocardia sp. TMWB2A TaxID=687430 RepID=UPI00307F60E2